MLVTPFVLGRSFGISFFGVVGAGTASGVTAPADPQVLQVSQLLCLLKRPFNCDHKPSWQLPQPDEHPPHVAAGTCQDWTGAGAQADSQQDFLPKLPLKRVQRPLLPPESPHAEQQPPPQLEPVDTTAGIGAGASFAGAGSAPAIQAEVSINKVAFTITNLRESSVARVRGHS